MKAAKPLLTHCGICIRSKESDGPAASASPRTILDVGLDVLEKILRMAADPATRLRIVCKDFRNAIDRSMTGIGVSQSPQLPIVMPSMTTDFLERFTILKRICVQLHKPEELSLLTAPDPPLPAEPFGEHSDQTRLLTQDTEKGVQRAVNLSFRWCGSPEWRTLMDALRRIPNLHSLTFLYLPRIRRNPVVLDLPSLRRLALPGCSMSLDFLEGILAASQLTALYLPPGQRSGRSQRARGRKFWAALSTSLTRLSGLAELGSVARLPDLSFLAELEGLKMLSLWLDPGSLSCQCCLMSLTALDSLQICSRGSLPSLSTLLSTLSRLSRLEVGPPLRVGDRIPGNLLTGLQQLDIGVPLRTPGAAVQFFAGLTQLRHLAVVSKDSCFPTVVPGLQLLSDLTYLRVLCNKECLASGDDARPCLACWNPAAIPQRWSTEFLANFTGLCSLDLTDCLHCASILSNNQDIRNLSDLSGLTELHLSGVAQREHADEGKERRMRRQFWKLSDLKMLEVASFSGAWSFVSKNRFLSKINARRHDHGLPPIRTASHPPGTGGHCQF